jgi:hypothetical protein
MINIIRAISITAYLFIILAGQMISLPFFVWLLFAAFDFGNTDQIFAILGSFGVILNFTKWKNGIPIMIMSFMLMLSPLVSRLVQVPIEKFNYLAFQIPVVIFIISYLVVIGMNIRHKIVLQTDF